MFPIQHGQKQGALSQFIFNSVLGCSVWQSGGLEIEWGICTLRLCL
jgi:hypothetical protein